MLLENGYILEFPENLAFDDDELFEFCQKNPDLNIERDKNKNLILMSPTGSLSGNTNSLINAELTIWNRQGNTGKVFDSSTGFLLPDGSMRSPDVSWVSNKQWNRLTKEQKRKFAPVCPEFIVEVKSPSDSTKQLQNKMLEWVANGVLLGWLIDIDEQKAYSYTSDGLQETVGNFENKLDAKDVLPGFELDLSLLKDE